MILAGFEIDNYVVQCAQYDRSLKAAAVILRTSHINRDKITLLAATAEARDSTSGSWQECCRISTSPNRMDVFGVGGYDLYGNLDSLLLGVVPSSVAKGLSLRSDACFVDELNCSKCLCKAE